MESGVIMAGNNGGALIRGISGVTLGSGQVWQVL